MQLSRTTIYVLAAFSLLLLLPLSCGGDDNDPPEDAYDSQGVDVMPGPSLVIMTKNGEDFTSAENTVTLEGLTDMTATAVTVGEMKATLDASELDYAQAWSIDLDLNEGENAFTIKALDEDGNEGLEKAVSITFDPEYVPDPPENGPFAFFVITWISGKCYDPVGARPSEMKAAITFQRIDSDGNVSREYPFPDASFTTNIGTRAVLGSLTESMADEATYILSVHVWEEDDGFFTGGDDEVGTGSVSFTAAEIYDGEAKSVSIDNNSFYVYSSNH